MSTIDIRTVSFSFCPHFRAGTDGAMCCITDRLLRVMEGFQVKLCMSRRHEACSVYMQSLQKMDAYGSYSYFTVAEPRQ